MRNFSLLALLFICLTTFLNAQTATVRGFVYNKNNGEPIIFSTVFLEGTTYGTQTDVNGFYSISKVPPGSYKLTFSGVNYEQVSVAISLKAGELKSQNIFADEKSVKLKEFEVSGQKEEEQTKVNIGVSTITPKEITKLPTVGAEPDIAQYLQVIPGVTFTGDQGGQLYIRGGSPIQNKVLLDGMIIYNPFHSIGLFSVFDTDVIRNAEVHTGGFSAEYGGRVSSIMNITTRDGNKSRLAGKVSVSPFVAKAMLEGPLSKRKEGSAGSSSFMLSGRTSYLEQTSKVFYPYVDTAGLPFNFTDLYGKLSFNSNNGSKLNLSGFNFSDRVRYRSLQDLSWNTFGFGTNFVLIPNANDFLFEGVFGYSDYKITLDEASKPSRNSRINGFNLALNFKYFMGDNDLQWGVEAIGFSTDFTFFNAVNREISQKENNTELALYAKYRWLLGNLVLEPSFRLHYYASLGNASPEPRMGAKFNVSDRFRLKAAAGLYSQNLIAGVSDRDVVNLFYGFLSAPENAPQTFKDQEFKTKLQRARHYIAGFESDLTKHIKWNVEAYFFDFNQLTNINRNKLFDDNAQNADVPDIEKKDLILEQGVSKGVDMTLKYEYKRFYVWAVYSIMKVTRTDELITYSPVWDRRHNVNLLASFEFGKDLNWSFSARWNFGSGFPFTQTQGFYENISLSGSLNQDYTTTNGVLGTSYGSINQGRLPTYHRLDLNLKRVMPLGDHTTLELTAGVTNAYNRENIFYFDRIKFERINQLPILPSLGANFLF
ncbi:MAG: TonB-dependent receptor [Bacteroidetes bacterium]|nr:TonB-dependent receptor [Bacteroidota bacterium]